MLHASPTNRDTFVRINAAATIGALLQKVGVKGIWYVDKALIVISHKDTIT